MAIRNGLALLLALLPAPLIAQSLVVTVVGQPAGVPLAGALVSLESPDGKRVARLLTNERGRAAISAPGPGRFRLRVDAIGYQGVRGDLESLAAGVTADRAVRLEPRPLNLEEIVVASTRPVQCDLEESQGSAAARLWDEARKALTGTQITRSSRGLELDIRKFERRLDAAGRILAETSESRRGPSTAPFVAADPDSLRRFGYVQQRRDGMWYHGPDADLLLSDQFLDDHCFRPAPGDGATAANVGLMFEPAKKRRVPDIAGVLWLDAKSLELRFIEFGYTGVEWAEGARGVGGRVEFTKLPNGGWVVGQWYIRMPVNGHRALLRGRADSLVGYREVGGTATPSSAVAKGNGATGVTGIAFDSLAGRPLAGAIVSIEEGTRADTTDEQGRYFIQAAGVGDFLITMTHPTAALRGYDAIRGTAYFRRGQVDTTNLALPGAAAVARRFCRNGLADSSRSLLLSAVLDGATGRPVPGAGLTIRSTVLGPVRATGVRTSAGPNGIEWLATPSEQGTLSVCGLPRGVPLRLRVMAPGKAPLDSLLAPLDRPVAEVLFRLPD